MNILTVTVNPTIDTSTNIDRVVADRKLRCARPIHEPGGGGINVSRAIKKLGGESLAIFPAGGTNGQHLIQLLENEGVQTSTVEINEPTRENFTVEETGSDKNYRFVMPGPKLNESEWQEIIEKVHNLKDKPNFLVASGSLPDGVPDDFYAQLAECCTREEIKIIIDTSGEPLKQAFKEGVFLIKPNMRELNDMIGEEIKDEKRLANRVKEFIKKSGTEYIVLSLGSGGALLITENYYKHFRSPTVQIKSKVGAGDSAVAGIVLSLSRGKSIEEAVQFGVAAGASAVSTPGSQLCDSDLTYELYDQIAGE